MSRYDYEMSREIERWASEVPFYSLVMALMRRADTDNLDKLRIAFPAVYVELHRRYNAVGGVLPEER